MAAAFFHSPGLCLAESEAEALATAMQDVASHYNILADEKQVAWVNLATTLGMIYGPRIAMVIFTKKPAAPAPPRPFVGRPVQANQPVNGKDRNVYTPEADLDTPPLD